MVTTTGWCSPCAHRSGGWKPTRLDSSLVLRRPCPPILRSSCRCSPENGRIGSLRRCSHCPWGNKPPVAGAPPQCPGCVPGAPGKPGSGTTAGAQGQPAGSAQPGAEGSRGLPGIIDRLPMTGANVMGLLVAGIVLVLVGFFVVGRRRRREEDNDAQTHRDPGANRQEGSANE